MANVNKFVYSCLLVCVACFSPIQGECYDDAEWIVGYRGQKYMIVPDSVTHGQAIACCEKHHARLISLEDEQEWNFLIKKVDPTTYWLGLKSGGKEASPLRPEGWEGNDEVGAVKQGNVADPSTLEWKWDDESVYSSSWTHWIDPDRGSGDGYCAVFYKPDREDWMWRNVKCSVNHPYVCEKLHVGSMEDGPNSPPDSPIVRDEEPVHDENPLYNPQQGEKSTLSDQTIIGISLGAMALVITMFAGGTIYRKYFRVSEQPSQEYYNTAEIPAPSAGGKGKSREAKEDLDAISTEALYNSNSTLEVVTPGSGSANNPLYGHKEGVARSPKPPPKQSPALALARGLQKKGELPAGVTAVHNKNYYSSLVPKTQSSAAAGYPHQTPPGAQRKESVIYDDTCVTQGKPSSNVRASEIYQNHSKSRNTANILGKLNQLFNRQPPPQPREERRESEFQYDYIDPETLGFRK